LTLFDLKPTAYGDLGTDDDVIDPARRFSGVTAGFVLPKGTLGGSQLYLDLFAWRRRSLVGTWGGRIGPARVLCRGAVARRGGPAGLDWSVNHQWGTFLNQGIDAWQAFLAQTWRLGNGNAKTAAPGRACRLAPAAVVAMATASCRNAYARSATTSISAISSISPRRTWWR
jgi:hypothetical protein